jgi:hypothetical protein
VIAFTYREPTDYWVKNLAVRKYTHHNPLSL